MDTCYICAAPVARARCSPADIAAAVARGMSPGEVVVQRMAARGWSKEEAADVSVRTLVSRTSSAWEVCESCAARVAVFTAEAPLSVDPKDIVAGFFEVVVASDNDYTRFAATDGLRGRLYRARLEEVQAAIDSIIDRLKESSADQRTDSIEIARRTANSLAYGSEKADRAATGAVEKAELWRRFCLRVTENSREGGDKP